jgi:hypothetical protein
VTAVRPFNRKSRVQRLLENVTDAPDAIKSGIPSGTPAKAGLIVAGSLAALTAASAGISSLRRQGGGS